MTYDEAEELIRDHTDYGGHVNGHALAMALSSKESIADTAGAWSAEQEMDSMLLDICVIANAYAHTQELRSRIAKRIRRAVLASPAIDAAGASDAEFKNFHRLLCERFGYEHDEEHWKRDQLSLIEHLAWGRCTTPAGASEGDVRNARRYRWLREYGYVELGCKSPRVKGWAPSALDEAIDAAIAKENGDE